MCVCVFVRDLIFVFAWYVPTNPRHSGPCHSKHGQTSSPWPGRPRTRHSRCGRPSVDRSSRGEQTIASTLNNIIKVQLNRNDNTFPISNILIHLNVLQHKREVHKISN